MFVAPNLSGAVLFETLPRGRQNWEASKNHQQVAVAKHAFERRDTVEEEIQSRGGLLGWIHRQAASHRVIGRTRCGGRWLVSVDQGRREEVLFNHIDRMTECTVSWNEVAKSGFVKTARLRRGENQP